MTQPMSVEKVERSKSKIVRVPARSSDVKPSQVNLVFEEKKSCCTCCECCVSSSVTDADLRALLREESRRRSTAKEKPTGSLKYQLARDGCAESGYFLPPRSVGKSTMEKLRKSNRATHDLPPPEAAIVKSNAKQNQNIKVKVTKATKKSTKEDPNMTEINQLLKRRLSGNISLSYEGPGEEGEALLSGRLMAPAITPYILSDLVQTSDTGHMRASFSESASGRRRSSFSRRSIDLTIEENVVRTQYEQTEVSLDKASDVDFINKLPKISKMVKNELEKNWSYTQRYVKTLERMSKSFGETTEKKHMKKQERWMVLFYTTSEESNDMINFGCNLIRLILQHHCVAYEERDVALLKKPFKKELQAKQEKKDITIPYVFAKGIAIGDTRIMFAIHKMKLMKVIFKSFIMAPDMYGEWLNNTLRNQMALSIEVKLSKYPALRTLQMKSTKVPLTSEEKKMVTEGKEIIVQARSKWQQLSREAFVQPDLLVFAQLKTTILRIYHVINAIYLGHTVGRDKRKTEKRFCPCC